MATPQENKPPEPPKEPQRPKEGKEGLFKYALTNTRDTIAYILLFIGIIMLFTTYYFWGALIIGMILGFYFAPEFKRLFQNFNEIVESFGIVKSLVIAGTLLAILIVVPGLFIGVALALAIRHLATFEETK